jgi:hypothetical protein
MKSFEPISADSVALLSGDHAAGIAITSTETLSGYLTANSATESPPAEAPTTVTFWLILRASEAQHAHPLEQLDWRRRQTMMVRRALAFSDSQSEMEQLFFYIICQLLGPETICDKFCVCLIKQLTVFVV